MRAPRFLVDENLSVRLPAIAHARGYEAAHVGHLGLRSWKDWDILDVIAKEDWVLVLVTNNLFEFRGRFRRLVVHPGIVFLVPSVRRPRQIELFSVALDDVERTLDLVTTALEILYEGDRILIRRYDLP